MRRRRALRCAGSTRGAGADNARLFSACRGFNSTACSGGGQFLEWRLSEAIAKRAIATITPIMVKKESARPRAYEARSTRMTTSAIAEHTCDMRSLNDWRRSCRSCSDGAAGSGCVAGADEAVGAGCVAGADDAAEAEGVTRSDGADAPRAPSVCSCLSMRPIILRARAKQATGRVRWKDLKELEASIPSAIELKPAIERRCHRAEAVRDPLTRTDKEPS